MGLLLHTLATAHPASISLNLVSMPGTQLTTSEESHSPDLTLFKSHKTLPRRKLFGNDFVPLGTLRTDHESFLGDHEQASYVSSERIRSWIPEPAAGQVILQRTLPLTPPSTSKGDAKKDWESKGHLTNGHANTFSGEKSGITTPVNQGSPPTPDITPSQDHLHVHRSASPLNPLSRTGSFITAREDQLSDDDLHNSQHEPLPSSHRNWSDSTQSGRLKDIGLGLKLHTGDDEKNNSRTIKGRAPPYQNHATFETAGVDMEGVLNLESGDQLRDFSDVTLRRRHKEHIQASTETQDTSSKTAEGAAVTRGLSLRERVERSRHSPPSASTERFAEQIEWPKDEMSRVKPRETENRRFSQLSATSTIVEAMVISTPPQRQRTLRHTGKITAFTSTGSPVAHSNRSSLMLNEQSYRQMLRSNKGPDTVKRSSVVSDSQLSAASTSSKSQPASIPVSVVPERRSTSPTRSRHESKASIQDLADQQKLRTTTASEQYIPIMDRPRPKLNALVPLPLVIPRQPINDQLQALHPPPLRRFHSSPPPLSGNLSRESTGNSTKLQVPSSEPESRASPMPQLSAHSTGLEHCSNGEWSTLRSTSAQITPFSLRSARSSTPGAFEVSEATAVNIYPHNNNSILVVQQMSRVDSGRPDGQTMLAEDANMALTNHTFPSVTETPHTVGSPLKNPRDPPRPPAFTVIPPTPYDTTAIEESSRGRTQRPPISKRMGAPISTIKRALSARRFSEPTMSAFVRSAARPNEVSHARPDIGPNPSNKLHPFWRPRGFWDDFSDDESEFGNDGLLMANTPSMPQRGMPVQKGNIPRSMSVGNRFRKPFGSLRGRNEVHKVRDTPSNGSMRDTCVVHPRYIIDNRKGRNQGEWVGLTGLKDRYLQNRREKEEQKREKERAKLRNSIGHIIVHPHTRVV